MEESTRIASNDLRTLRKRAGLHLKDVAFLLDIKSIGRISEWEQGIASPGLDNLIKLEIIYQRLIGEMFFELRAQYAKDIEERKRLLAGEHPQQRLGCG